MSLVQMDFYCVFSLDYPSPSGGCGRKEPPQNLNSLHAFLPLTFYLEKPSHGTLRWQGAHYNTHW